MGDAMREAYQDIFLIKAKPTKADQGAISGKFKSFHNASDDVAQRMSKTFFGLLELADLSSGAERPVVDSPPMPEVAKAPVPNVVGSAPSLAGLHYNVQIHLPATKDVEVYNAIFKSLREHFVD